MRTRSIFAVMMMALSIIAAPAHAAPSLTVGVAYDIGGRGDKSFNDASAAGLEKAQKQFDFSLEAVVTDGTTSDREKRIRSLLTKKCDPIIAIGAGYAPTLQALAVEFPNTHFAIINDAHVAALNVTSLIFADTQGAYLAGYSAAQVSKTGKVAMIANPDQADIYKDGFSAGVFAAKKKVIPIVKYVSGSYTSATNQVLDAGADIVFVATQGSDSAVFQAIVARNAKKKGSTIGLINIEPDQYITVTSATKKYLIASVVKRVDKAMFDVISLAQADKQYLDILDSEAGIYGRRYGITGGGIEFTIRSGALLGLSDAINAAAVTAAKLSA
jgi:basic membrane protein A